MYISTFDLQTEVLSDTISQFLTLLAQGPVSSNAIQDIVDFEISLAQVCDTTL